MATKTINGLTVTTSAAAGDFVPIWRASNGDTRKITKANFIGATITGGGTIATGGFTLTVGLNSTVTGSLVGNITGAGTIATGGFTLTVPATGTAALLSGSQTFTGLKTFSAGINLGDDNLANYKEGTWTPTLTGSSGAPTITYTTQDGYYTRIGNIVKFSFNLVVNTISGGSGNIRIGSFPITSSSSYQPICAALVEGVDVPSTPVSVAFQMVSSDTKGALISVQDNASAPSWNISTVAAGDRITVGGFYFV